MSAPPDRDAELTALIELGIAAARHGRHERARRYLEAALAADAQNEEALLWLAAVTDDRDRASELVQRALRRNPDNPRAQAALRWLDQTAADTSAPPEAGASAPFRPPWEAYAPGAEAPDALDDLEALPPELLVDRPPPEEPLEEAPVIGGVPPEGGRPEAVERGALRRASARLSAAAAPPSAGRGGRVRPRLTARHLANALMGAMLGVVVLGSAALATLLTDDVQAQRIRVALGVVASASTEAPESPAPPAEPSPEPPEGGSDRPAPGTTRPSLRAPTTESPAAADATPTANPTATETPVPTPTPTTTPPPTEAPEPTATPEWAAALGPLPLEGKWIEVDLTGQVLRAYEGAGLVLSAPISSGRPGLGTRQGRFRIQSKHVRQNMAGVDFYLPNVPHVQYFVGGIALHGAYWEVDWGTPTSHGCVNLTLEDAAWLFDWTDPPLPEGANTVRATEEEPGTWVLVHK